MSDQTGSPEPAAAPPPPPPPTEPTQGATPPAEEPQTQQQAAQATPANKTKKAYGIFTELTLPVGKAAERKAASEKLAELLVDGQEELTVLVRVGKASATGPKKALGELGQHRQLDGDYQVIAASAHNIYEKVKTSTKVDVQIG